MQKQLYSMPEVLNVFSSGGGIVKKSQHFNKFNAFFSLDPQYHLSEKHKNQAYNFGFCKMYSFYVQL